jgi:hypothetical protein
MSVVGDAKIAGKTAVILTKMRYGPGVGTVADLSTDH